MNNVSLVGRLTRDPELRFTADGTGVASFTLAVRNPFKKDEDGNFGAPDYPQCVVWGKQAEALAEHCRKGRRLAVTGRIVTRSYEHDEKGMVYVTEVNCDNIEFLDEPNGNDDEQALAADSRNNTGSGNGNRSSGSSRSNNRSTNNRSSGNRGDRR